jgi:uncharacterized protein (DUF433 family)
MTKAIEANLLERVHRDPRVLAGKPVIVGTRISVDFILKLMAQGMSQPEILREYPRLKTEDLQAALLYAEKILEQEAAFPLPACRPRH